jgi:hypothetical protein
MKKSVKDTQSSLGSIGVNTLEGSNVTYKSGSTGSSEGPLLTDWGTLGRHTACLGPSVLFWKMKSCSEDDAR